MYDDHEVIRGDVLLYRSAPGDHSDGKNQLQFHEGDLQHGLLQYDVISCAPLIESLSLLAYGAQFQIIWLQTRQVSFHTGALISQTRGFCHGFRRFQHLRVFQEHHHGEYVLEHLQSGLCGPGGATGTRLHGGQNLCGEDWAHGDASEHLRASGYRGHCHREGTGRGGEGLRSGYLVHGSP